MMTGAVTAGVMAVMGAAPSPLLPPDHWATRAAERLEARGLAEGYLPAQRAPTLEEVAQALHAVEDPGAQVEAWRRRLDAEFLRRPLVASVRAGVDGRTLRDTFPEGRRPLGHLAALPGHPVRPFVGAALVLHSPFLAAFAEGRVMQNALELGEWEVAAEALGAQLSVGRRPLAYGFGNRTGVVFSGAQPLHRVELRSARAFRLPGVLSRIGLFSLHTSFGLPGQPRHPASARLLTMSAHYKPVPRLTLAANRATMFGSEGLRGLSAFDWVRMFTLTHNGGENNLISGAFRFRLPTESFLPITLHGEWGTEDSAGNHLYTPGLVAGLWTPALPFAPGVAVGVEHAFIGQTVRRNLRWYTHSRQRGGWVVNGLPLGHPMGGNGREWRLHASWHGGDVFVVDGAAFHRTRFARNLYSPEREGRSAGGELSFSARPTPLTELSMRGAFEGGAHFRELTVHVGGAARF